MVPAMGGPFRLQPPVLPAWAVLRARLLTRLARRWERRLVTVVAGPGFGKTSLLVSAMSQPSPAADDRDVWLSCEPSDADAESLLAGLGKALGLDRCASVDDVVTAVWLRAPHRVCLVLDEVHEIPSGSDGARVLARLLAELPRNGHVVLASRVKVPVPVAVHASRRELERIVEADLVFDQSELAAFAEARGVDVAVLSSSGGWPAVAELAATAGTDLVFEYVWEEVLATIGDVRARQLAWFAVAGGGDDTVVAAIVPVVGGVEDLVAGLPLVARTGGGWVTLHPLWGPVLRGLLTAEEADESRCAAAVVHREAGRYDQAVSLFAESQAWSDVLAAIRCAEIEPGYASRRPAVRPLVPVIAAGRARLPGGAVRGRNRVGRPNAAGRNPGVRGRRRRVSGGR